MTEASTDPVIMTFASDAMAPETFDVSAFRGEEAISRLYRFEIDLVADDPDIDLEKLLYAPAVLTIEKGDHRRRVHGILNQCRISDALPDGRYCYHVVLVPSIWLLSLNRQNQIYQQLNFPDIIAEEIRGTTAKETTKPAAAGLTTNDFELRLADDPILYPVREYTVQYDETDLDFVSRLMEHVGIFYFFVQEDGSEKMVICDNNVHFTSLEEDAIAYRPPSGMARAGDEAVRSISYATRRIPRKTVLKDFNYRRPSVIMQVDADVDPQAQGVVCAYGDHFKSSDEGAKLARVRAEALICGKRTLSGASNSLRLVPGISFGLEEHFRQDMNRPYVVTAIRHEGRQPLESTTGMAPSEDARATYDNQFSCIPSDVAFRPQRITPRPRISGLMNARVDAAVLEDRAEIDKQGRYKLVMPFDLSDAEAGKASRYVRKAQPYGGKEMGMHFPLHKDTEVICDFVNGDPDRPIITGVVPNPETASVVSESSFTKNRIKTASGVLIEVNDGPGGSNDQQ